MTYDSHYRMKRRKDIVIAFIFVHTVCGDNIYDFSYLLVDIDGADGGTPKKSNTLK